MSEGPTSVGITRRPTDEIESTVESIKKMLKVGAVFAVIGYLLTGHAF